MANFRQIGTDFTNGVRAPHYTNGRLLTAEDLQRDQRAALERIALTGRGAGAGIIDGFNVSAVANRSSLQVTAGLGINANGDMLQLLAESVLLPIQPIAADEPAIRRSGRFGECDGTENPAATLDSGAYLLTVAPLSRLEGSVPRQSCAGTETSTCANQWEVEGIEFKIIRLAKYTAPTGSRAQRNQNLLAHWFYGSDKLCNLMRDPFQFDSNYTGYAQISAEDFTKCDLPLAIFNWNNQQIDFVDEWAVRRRLIHAYPTTTWYANLSDQRKAEGEARFLQFQTHLDEIRNKFGANASRQKAVTHFGYLPPVAFLPINPFELIYTDIFVETLTKDRELSAEIQRRELSIIELFTRVRTIVLGTFENNNLFQLENFFDDLLPDEYQIVHEDLIHDRLHQSWVQPPIVLPPPPVVVGSQPAAGFDFVTTVGERVPINVANINSVFTSVFTATRKVALTQSIADRITRTPTIGRNPPNSGPGLGGDNDTLNPPLGAAARLIGRAKATSPLIDILVMDELLAPYRTLLSNEMVDIIRGAIISLVNGGGIFTGSNRFKSASQEISHRFLATSFVAVAITRGLGLYTDLLQLVNRTKEPLFYVAFVRHRPEVIRRPLHLPDLDNQDG